MIVLLFYANALYMLFLLILCVRELVPYLSGGQELQALGAGRYILIGIIPVFSVALIISKWIFEKREKVETFPELLFVAPPWINLILYSFWLLLAQ